MELVLVRDLSPFNLPLLSRELFALFTRARKRERERGWKRSIARGRQLEKYAKNSAQIKKKKKACRGKGGCLVTAMPRAMPNARPPPPV